MTTQAELTEAKAEVTEAKAETEKAHVMIGAMTAIMAVGALLGLIGQEIAALPDWAQAKVPGFVGKVLAHIATVIAAFVSGQYLKSPRERL
jgi:hypothetical protein